METATVSTRSWRRQGVVAAVHRSCRHCQAPGTFTPAEHIRTNPAWSACYVEQGDPREGQSVGDTCPACGRSRNPSLIERLGEIWHRQW